MHLPCPTLVVDSQAADEGLGSALRFGKAVSLSWKESLPNRDPRDDTGSGCSSPSVTVVLASDTDIRIIPPPTGPRLRSQE